MRLAFYDAFATKPYSIKSFFFTDTCARLIAFAPATWSCVIPHSHRPSLHESILSARARPDLELLRISLYNRTADEETIYFYVPVTNQLDDPRFVWPDANPSGGLWANCAIESRATTCPENVRLAGLHHGRAAPGSWSKSMLPLALRCPHGAGVCGSLICKWRACGSMTLYVFPRNSG